MNLQTLRSQYRDALLLLAEERKLENVRIFGSTLRGESREDSDIDLLVHPKKGCSLLDLVQFELDASDLLGGRKVDVISDGGIREELEPFILGEAVPL